MSDDCVLEMSSDFGAQEERRLSVKIYERNTQYEVHSNCLTNVCLYLPFGWVSVATE